MDSETEKLKMKLELMNQELAERKRKLKKHSRKKLKLTKDIPEVLKNDMPDYITEKTCSLAKADNADALLNGASYSTNVVYDANELNEMTSFSLTKDLPSTLIKNNQDSISCYDKNLTLSQTSVQNVSLQGMSVVEEASIQLGQVSVVEPFQNPANTPQKIIFGDVNSLSPILMQKSAAKPQDRHLQRKLKYHPLSSRSTRKDFSSSEISDSIENTFGNDTAMHVDDYSVSENNTAATVICSADNTLPATENMHPKTEEIANVTDVVFASHKIKLSRMKGQILFAFCGSSYFISVQENEINFWSLSGTEPVHLHVGNLSRKDIGMPLGCKGNTVKVGSEVMSVCMELWATEINTSTEEQTTTLTCVVYCYSFTKKNLKSYSLHLKKLPGHIKNVQMCVLPEMSLIVSWMTNDIENLTSIIKFSIDNDSQCVLKSSELSSVEGVINSLHYIKGCWAVVLGQSDTQMVLWEHCTGVLVKTIYFPRNETVFQWVEEDQGFLFIAISGHTHIKFIAVNLTTSKWKELQQFPIPETYKLMGVGVDKRRLVAVFMQGILCWDLKSGQLLGKTHNKQENVKTFLGEKYAGHITTDFTVNFVCINSVETINYSLID